jgi:alpha-galactosidase
MNYLFILLLAGGSQMSTLRWNLGFFQPRFSQNMSDGPINRSRRAFLGDAVRLGLGSIVLNAAQKSMASPSLTPAPDRASAPIAPLSADLRRLPDSAFIDHDGAGLMSAARAGSTFSSDQCEARLVVTEVGLKVRVACPAGPIARVVLRWEAKFPPETLFLGDAWERSYGDLQWRSLEPERVLPWYFAAHDAGAGGTYMAGVRTQPSALCFWTVDAAGISLWMDFRNGGSPCVPGNREIEAAEVVSLGAGPGEAPMASLARFCRMLCPAPLPPPGPVCGNNNWYYAYGRDFDADAMRRDASFLAEIAAGHPNRPFCVIDAGWTPNNVSVCPGGPWKAGDPGRFPDMPGLALEMRNLGVRPGIWIRPTALMDVDDPRRLRAGPCTSVEKPLDLTLSDNLSLIREDVARVRGWGFELVKHDFSTYDFFGRWGFEMGADLTDPGWRFADSSLTNAEIILRHYRNLRAAAGDAVLLGCNTIGHLGAGLFEVQRTGDDTSGRVWERTRRMGINTLAFRLPQNRAFFVCDPDCAAHTGRTPWPLDRQFLDLVARSGASLFISVDPRTVTVEQRAAYRAAMHLALSGGAPGGCEPLDWLHTTAPREWRGKAGTESYTWEEPFGANPMRV